MEHSSFKRSRVVSCYQDLRAYPVILTSRYLHIQISRFLPQNQDEVLREQQKDLIKDLPFAVGYPKVNLCRAVGSKFIFLQCKKPFPHALRSGERRMLPMVAVRKLGEVCQ